MGKFDGPMVEPGAAYEVKGYDDGSNGVLLQTEFVQAWNHHLISGPTGGIPINLADNNGAQHVFPKLQFLQLTKQYIHLHKMGGIWHKRALLEEIYFKSTPIYRHYVKDFFARYSSMNMIYENVLHNNGNLFKDSIIHWIIALLMNYSIIHQQFTWTNTCSNVGWFRSQKSGYFFLHICSWSTFECLASAFVLPSQLDHYCRGGIKWRLCALYHCYP